jgi:hypothetical protein
MRVLAIFLLLFAALFVDVGTIARDRGTSFIGLALACVAVMLWSRRKRPGALEALDLADLNRRLHDLEAQIAPVQAEIAATHADIDALKSEQWFFRELYSGRMATEEEQRKERSGEIG